MKKKFFTVAFDGDEYEIEASNVEINKEASLYLFTNGVTGVVASFPLGKSAIISVADEEGNEVTFHFE